MATNFAITGGVEILQVAEAVAREKNIPKEAVIEALENAIETVAKKKYGHEQMIKAQIDQKSGEISLVRERIVVKHVENMGTEISIREAEHKKADAKEGDTIIEPLPPIDFGRVTSQTVKQVVIGKVRDAERQRQYEDFKDRVGEIVTGVVKRVEYGNLILDFGKTETMMPRDQVLPRETYRVGDRVRAYIVDVRRENKGPQIILSRTHPDFLASLFKQEVPEIYDGMISIKAVARDPGSRSKVSVYAGESSIDPVGACIGPRGARVMNIYNELQGEKIDIIEWSPDLATFAVNALTTKTKEGSLEVLKIVIDEDSETIEAVVPDEQLSLAIGRRGQNVRLAAALIGWRIDVMSESQESQRRSEEFKAATELFSRALNVEEVIGQLLASEGFKNVEEVAFVPKEDLMEIEGFDEDLVSELQRRAEDFLEEERKRTRDEWTKLGVSEELTSLPHLSDAILVKLGKKGVKTLDDVADLARDDFRDLVPDSGLTGKEIDAVIMKAREHWFPEGTEDGANNGGVAA